MSPTTTPVTPSTPNTEEFGTELFSGRIVHCVVFINVVVNTLAHAVADELQLPISLPGPTPQLTRPKKRPCIFLRRDAHGYLVIPMATFKKSHPNTWDLFLRQLVVPVGAPETILAMMRDRVSFETTPPWKYVEPGVPTYLIPHAVLLPPGTAIELDDFKIPSQELVQLKEFCRLTTARLGELGKEEMTRILRSYANRHGGIPQAPCPQSQDEDGPAPSAGAPSQLNPSAASFVSRISVAPPPSDNMSTPEMFKFVCEQLSACGGSNAQSPAPSPSLHQVLQENNAQISDPPTTPPKSTKPSTVDKVDKENCPA
ncbi:hypothetical protein AURDEDRAFT_185697 [Auricularia subglabra TFB-10046 SS5]|nr:hypothetical protein AURDEDRAFT_185697 [Auricularia subglabra TFB-10046 SS5]